MAITSVIVVISEESLTKTLEFVIITGISDCGRVIGRNVRLLLIGRCIDSGCLQSRDLSDLIARGYGDSSKVLEGISNEVLGGDIGDVARAE